MVVLALAMVLTAGLGGVAFAGIQGTAHDIANSQGVCANCHIPHKALGSRLWPSAAGTGAATWNTVGGLCYYCHGTGGQAAALAVNTVFNTSGHPVKTVGSQATASDVTPSGLPYTNDGDTAAVANFECTSCHNAHADKYSTTNPTQPAFLIQNPGTLCASCHQSRQYVGGVASTATGAWGAFYGASNPGSHPVGTDVKGDSDTPANSAILVAADFQLAHDTGVGTHRLGGHALGTGTDLATNGMGCVTCHAVHGKNTAADGEAGSSAPVESLLVPTFAQGSLNGIANGNTDKFNVLCENCHGTLARPRTLAGASDPNPSASGKFTHPVDQMTAQTNTGTIAAVSGWPYGSTAGGNMDVALICESCHLMHPNADAVTEGDHLTRQANVCAACHTGNVPNHHPIAATMPTGYSTTGSVSGADGTNTSLSCYDCHNGNGAHNWRAVGEVGLNATWEPTNNGRSTDAATSTATKVNALLSRECVKCHNASDMRANPSPGTHVSRGATDKYTDGTGRTGTHWIGTNGTGTIGPGVDYTLGFASQLNGSVTTTRNAWNALAAGTTWAKGGWSRFIDSTGSISCESCHELEPAKNEAGTKLLLAYYVEGADQVRDPLCEGCHGKGSSSGRTHPMTGDTVGKRGGAVLTTAPATAPYIINPPNGQAHYPATAGRMNCDSCHQPHEAKAGKIILEDGSGTTITYTGGKFTGLDFQALCSDCHTGYY